MARIYRPPTLSGTLRSLQRQQRVQGSASVLARSGLSVPDENVTAVDGDLQAESFVAGSAGWRLQAGGNAEFNDLTLRGGIIGNDALTDPVVPQVVNIRTSNFSVGVPFAEVLGQTLTVPSGCTRLQITQSCWLQLLNAKTTGGNNGTGGDYVYVQAVIGGVVGDYTATGVSGSGGTATASSGLAQLLTGLTPGGTVRVSAYGATDYTIAASTVNKCLLTATLTWLR